MLAEPKYQILVIGHLNYDYIINIQEFAGLNASQNINELKIYDGGNAANTALVAASFVPSAFYTIVGSDFPNSRYFRKLKNHDNCLAILEKIDNKTSTCFVITDNKSNQKSYIYQGAANKFIYLEPPKRYIDKTEIVHITTAPPKFAIKCAKYAYNQNKKVSFNPGQNLRLYTKEQLKEMLKYTYFLFGNEYEFDYIFGKLNGLGLDIFSGDSNLEYLITTQGEKGSMIESKNKDEDYHISSFKTNAVDSTGAGDAYCGAFLAAYLQNKPIDECGRFASATASFIVEKYGCQTNIPTKKQVEERLK